MPGLVLKLYGGIIVEDRVLSTMNDLSSVIPLTEISPEDAPCPRPTDSHGKRKVKFRHLASYVELDGVCRHGGRSATKAMRVRIERPRRVYDELTSRK